jgi:hypothetical protein
MANETREIPAPALPLHPGGATQLSRVTNQCSTAGEGGKMELAPCCGIRTWRGEREPYFVAGFGGAAPGSNEAVVLAGVPPGNVIREGSKE